MNDEEKNKEEGEYRFGKNRPADADEFRKELAAAFIGNLNKNVSESE